MTTHSSVDPNLLQPLTGPVLKSFIEVQFPVSKISKESYKERKAVGGQTLTGLGKWWGRKPLVLVRAVVLGLTLPATDDPEKDREIFLALMTMDEEGLEARRQKSISAKEVAELLPPSAAGDAITRDGAKVSWRKGLSVDQRKQYQHRAFRSLSYDRQLDYCLRPEEIDGPSESAWKRINSRLGTNASSLSELVQELGERRWGHVPKVGDAFSGGGSIPFEAARLGCDVYASDINPVAGLLTWGALNIVGGGEEVVERVKVAQRRVYDAVRKQVDDWGIERNEQGWIADAYLYCNEVVDPVTGWSVPLAPTWVIATKANVIARLVPDELNKRFEIKIAENVSTIEFKQAADEGTSSGGIRCPVDRDGNWLQPSQRQITSMEQLRGPRGLRRWNNDDIVPRVDDVYRERLYCIRWLDPMTGQRRYLSPDEHDLAREERVLELLMERFSEWQAKGYIPSREIESGNKTDEPIRTRGWTHWHHLFNPRQLLFAGLYAEHLGSTENDLSGLYPFFTLMKFRYANWNSRLVVWNTHLQKGEQTFYNQALNALANYIVRPSRSSHSIVNGTVKTSHVRGNSVVELGDVRQNSHVSDIWITDPGYGDSVNYDEISEFFLAWYDERLNELFPEWYSDSRRALNIKGEGEQFRIGLTEAYTNLTKHMPDDGYQVVMFTHQDSSVWADVGLTLWAAGLQVSAAWTIATETGGTGLRQGNYVQGTVCLVLRKRTSNTRGYLSDIHPEIQQEVKRQIEAMTELDDRDDPNFGDADYQLAAYAAALRVLTAYSSIDEIDIDKELRRPRERGVTSPITRLIEQAVRIASDSIVPNGIERATWRRLAPEERLYLKGIETEASGEGREGVYQELARSYGAGPHRELYASTSANAARFKTASEFARRDLGETGEAGFQGSLLRRLLYAVYQTATSDDRDPRSARVSLRTDVPDYWSQRTHMIALLAFLIRHTQSLPHWSADSEAMRLLQTSLDHDAV